MVKTKTQIKHNLRLAVTFLLIGIVGTSIVWVYASPLSTFYISGGVYPSGCWTVWTEGGKFYSKNAYGYSPSWSDNTNASPVIQGAIDALPTEGGKVLIKAGLYPIYQTINLTSNLILEGEGGLGYYGEYGENPTACTVLRLKANVDLLNSLNQSGMTIRYLFLNGENRTNVSLINMTGGRGRNLIEQNILRYVGLYTDTGYGIYFNYISPKVFDTSWIQDNRILDCHISIYVKDSSLIWIENNDLSGGRYQKVYFQHSDNSWLCSNNIDTSTGYRGVDCYNSDRLKIIGNYIHFCNETGLVLRGGSDYNIINANIFYDNGKKTANTYYGIYVDASYNNTVTSNSLKCINEKYGINEWSGDYNFYHGNYIEGGVTGAINTGGLGANSVASDNFT